MVTYKGFKNFAPSTTGIVSAAQKLHNCPSDIVNEAKTEVLNYFPYITKPGVRLSPSKRSEAYWRDLWRSLRCIAFCVVLPMVLLGSMPTTPVLKDSTVYNCSIKNYKWPLDAMAVGLEGVKTARLKQVELKQPT